MERLSSHFEILPAGLVHYHYLQKYYIVNGKYLFRDKHDERTTVAERLTEKYRLTNDQCFCLICFHFSRYLTLSVPKSSPVICLTA